MNSCCEKIVDDMYKILMDIDKCFLNRAAHDAVKAGFKYLDAIID